MQEQEVLIEIYKWEGQFGPFKINIPCGECSLTQDIVQDVLSSEFKCEKIKVISYPWLAVWWRPLLLRGWHAPIVVVDGKLVCQGVALNRGVLIEALATAIAKRKPISGNHLYGKTNCSYCKQAKALLKENGIETVFHDVIKDTRALYDMLARVKPKISSIQPVTVPQIWLEGKYIGGADHLAEHLLRSKEKK